MSTVPNKSQILSLYRNILRGGHNFIDFNFREYVLRVAREDFRKYRNESDPQKINQLFQRGVEQLGIVQRQSTINRMYAKRISVLDKNAEKLLNKQQ